MFNSTAAKTLIVVYKDELLANQIKKLVETNDDNGTNEVVVQEIILLKLFLGMRKHGYLIKEQEILIQKFCLLEI